MIAFPSQKPYERTELFLRRHKLILFLIYFWSGLLALLGLAAFYFSKNFMLLEGDILTLIYFFLTIYLMIIWQFLFKGLTDYYLDTWIVTDHRILEIHQIGLFKRDISELRLSKIQDVSVKIEGITPTFFNYGDLIIQTAGVVQEFKFEEIPNPQKVKDEILRLHDQFMKEHPGGNEIHE